MQITQGNWQARVNPERGSLGFTRTEAQDLMLLAAGNTYKEIARATGRSPESVKACLQRAYQKLGAFKAAGAVAEAIRRGWIAPLIIMLMISAISPDMSAGRHRTPSRSRIPAAAQARLAQRTLEGALV